jgi:hypothetical protein
VTNLLEKYKQIIDSENDDEIWYSIKFNKYLERIDTFQKHNNIRGNILEIGVFRGLSFIPLRTLLKNDECIVAIDLFDTYFNHELSKDMFIKNVIKVFDNLDNTIIITENSTNLSPNSLRINHYQYRIISVDGGHDYSTVINDLNLSMNILNDEGIIIVDDYNNTNWPEVKSGTDKFLEDNRHMGGFSLYDCNKFLIGHKAHKTYQYVSQKFKTQK